MTKQMRALVDRVADAISSGKADAGAVAVAVRGEAAFDLAVVPDSAAVWSVTIPVDGSLTMDEMEEEYGSASRIPPTLHFPSPRFRMSGGGRPVTLILETQEDGQVSKVVVQADKAQL